MNFELSNLSVTALTVYCPICKDPESLATGTGLEYDHVALSKTTLGRGKRGTMYTLYKPDELLTITPQDSFGCCCRLIPVI